MPRSDQHVAQRPKYASQLIHVLRSFCHHSRRKCVTFNYLFLSLISNVSFKSDIAVVSYGMLLPSAIILRILKLPSTLSPHHSLLHSVYVREPFAKLVDSPYYSKPELCGGAMTDSFLKYLP